LQADKGRKVAVVSIPHLAQVVGQLMQQRGFADTPLTVDGDVVAGAQGSQGPGQDFSAAVELFRLFDSRADDVGVFTLAQSR